MARLELAIKGETMAGQIETKGQTMTHERASDIGRIGGCGLVALAVLKRNCGKPLLRYDADGNAIHAAALIDGQPVHWGDSDEGFVEVSNAELKRACMDDFEPSRVNIVAGEIKRVVQLMGLWS